MQLGLIRFQERKFRWLILSAMSGSAQTARSPTQRLICKTLYILAYAELLGSAALELRCRGYLRRSAVFPRSRPQTRWPFRMRLLIPGQRSWAACPPVGFGAVAGLGGGRQANPEPTQAPAGKELPWSLLPQQTGWGTQRYRGEETGFGWCRSWQ
jgi:hypothetical protein